MPFKDVYPGNIHIGDLSFRYEKTEILPFVAERDITDEDWREMIDLLSSDSESLYEDFMYGSNLKLLFPEKVDDIFSFGKDWYQQAESQKESYRDSWTLSLNQLQTSYDERSDAGLRLFADNAVRIKRILPTEFRDVRNLTPQTFQEMKKELEHLRIAQKWGDFADFAKDIRILFPTRQDKMGITSNDWKAMAQSLEGFRMKGQYRKFGELAASMKILLAETLTFDEKEGLLLTMPEPKKKQSAPSPLPVRKKYPN